MTMHSMLCTTTLLLCTLASGSALAHPAPYSHYHPAPKKKKVIYRTTPAPPSHVVVVDEEPIVRPRVTIKTRSVTVTRPSRPHRTIVAAPTHRNQEPRFPSLSVGIRTDGAFASEDSIPDNGLPLGGGGAVLRTRMSPNVGAELAVDVLAGEGVDYAQTTVPVFASATYHFLPQSIFQPYVVAGVGADFTRKEFLGGRFAYDRIDVGAQVGVGAEFYVMENISLTADARYKVMGNANTTMKMRSDCIATSGTLTGFCDNIQSTGPGEDFYHGVQFGVGAHLHF